MAVEKLGLISQRGAVAQGANDDLYQARQALLVWRLSITVAALLAVYVFLFGLTAILGGGSSNALLQLATVVVPLLAVASVLIGFKSLPLDFSASTIVFVLTSLLVVSNALPIFSHAAGRDSLNRYNILSCTVNGIYFVAAVLIAGLLLRARSSLLVAAIASVSVSDYVTNFLIQNGTNSNMARSVWIVFALLLAISGSSFLGVAAISAFSQSSALRLNQQQNARTHALLEANSQISTISSERLEIAGSVTRLADQVDSNARQQLATTTQQATAATTITTTVHELSAAAEQIANLASQAASSAEQAEKETRSAANTISEALSSLTGISGQVAEIANQVAILSERAQDIEAVAERMNDIADEIKLLALNATIEAAGAGEHGRRFAVVAAEVERLAEEARVGAEQSRTLISELRRANHATAQATSNGREQAQQGSALARKAGEAANRIARLVATANSQVHSISTSTQQQRTASAQVASLISDLGTSTTQTATGSLQNAAVARQLTTLAHQLEGKED